MVPYILLILCHNAGVLSLLPTPTFVRTVVSSGRSLQHRPGLRRRMQDPFMNDGEEFGRDMIEALTVPQLKQQLRLRGLKISGKKEELVDRLFAGTGGIPRSGQSEESWQSNDEGQEDNKLNFVDDELMLDQHTSESNDVLEPEVLAPDDKKSKAREFAAAHNKELIDVTAYLDEEEIGKEVRSSKDTKQEKVTGDEDSQETSPESWGSEARIVDDYEGRSVIIDNLSRCVVEFLGSNQTMCPALVVASRDALKPFLAGNSQNQTSAEERLREIQTRREEASKERQNVEDFEAVDEGDDEGVYKNIVDREFSDWGEYTATGAQLSATEVQGVLLLSDVYGPFSNHTRALAEKIAFECQPVVVMVPDLFRGCPWEQINDSGLNKEGETYEQWRANHDELRVSVDIRAAAACLRERYGVSSVALWGTCYGGGRALEAASGVLPNDSIHDVDGNVGPLPVNPMACVAWYPTRYNATNLFGPSHRGKIIKASDGSPTEMSIMAIFAGKDDLSGATQEDAAILQDCLAQDQRVKDHMVKIFADQEHGFAHMNLGKEDESQDEYENFVDEGFGGAGKVGIDNGEAEVACLLSTAWMETYSRVFLPTVGSTISQDENEGRWQNIEMEELSAYNLRDIRGEIENALNDFEYVPDFSKQVDRFDENEHETLKQYLMEYQTDDDAEDNKILPSDELGDAYQKILKGGYDLW